MKVCKFGGTSMADAAQIRKVCDIVLSDPERRLIVVSAPGKRSKTDTKVTDLLIALAEKCLAGGPSDKELAAVVGRYGDIARGLGLGDDITRRIEADLRARIATDRSDRGRFLDTLKAAGEDNCAKLVAEFLRSTKVDARYLSPKDAGLLLSHEFGNAQVLPESYENLRRALGQARGITIFPGFFGYSPQGAVVTLPRGGSDITGSILAAAVKADVYENFTDVDSVFVASPSIIQAPRAIAELTYREMRELSYAGFSVFHEEALAPVFHAGVPVCIKNTNNPSAPGTCIVMSRICPLGQVAGIAHGDGFCSVYVSKYLMNREIGFGRRLLQILEEEGLSYEHTPSGIDNISVILREKQFDAAKEARVIERVRSELSVDDVSVERGLALVMIVGECMRNAVGLAARACSALARADVNIEMINQGSSEVSMMFGVKTADAEKAVRSLYQEFFGTKAS
jgi:aspartate kinase